MKKILFGACIILSTVAFLSCKSTKNVEEQPIVVSEGSSEEVIVEAPKSKTEEKKIKKEAEEKAKKEAEAKKKAEANKKEDKDSSKDEERGMFGWIEGDEKNPEFSDGIVRIKTDGKLGTFCIFAIDRKGKEIPVFSTLNEYSSTSFYLKVGNKKYRLHTDKNVKSAAKALDNGIAILYKIDKVADVYVKIEVFPTVMDSPADTIKFTIDVKNTSKQPDDFELKVILDTVLGERRSNHFYTYDNIPITSEYAVRSMDEEGFFTSKNEKASMQLLFNGGDTTPPSFFALASFSRLEGSDWEPNMHTLGAFDTVLSYNNSAVCAIWPTKHLGIDKSGRNVFYLSLALDEDIPNGYRFVYQLGEPEKVVEEEKPLLLPPSAKKPTTPKEVDMTVPKVVKPAVKEEEVKSVEFNVDNIKKEHLTPEYVQSLITRINELESSGAQLNRAEILQLNAELDAILTILKK